MQKKKDAFTLSLMVTEKCNLKCVYCYEHNKSFKDMSYQLAIEILDKNLRNFDFEKNMLIIDFFGGEPFENFPLIKKVVRYVENTYATYINDIKFFVTTNGTLINDDVKKFLIEKKDKLIAGLSLDGNKTAHDINRSNSFDLIDLDFFIRNYPNQPVKMTISQQSLPYLYDSIVFLTRLGFKIECNLAFGIDWHSENNKQILEEQLNLLIDFYAKNPQTPRCSMLNMNIKLIPLTKKSDKISKWCGCGTNMATYSIYGIKYPCQMFVPVSSPVNINFKPQKGFPRCLLDEKCKDCYVQPICPFCYGINSNLTGNPYHQDDERCELYKIIFKANAKLNAIFWKNKYLTMSYIEEQALLHAILEIQKI